MEKGKGKASPILLSEPPICAAHDWTNAERFLDRFEELPFHEKLQFEDEVSEAFVKSEHLPGFENAIEERMMLFNRALQDARSFRAALRRGSIGGTRLNLLREAVYTRFAEAMNEFERWTGDVSQVPGVLHFDTKEDVQDLLDAFRNRGYKELDTASNYLGSEVRLGRAGAGAHFTIHTKVRSWGDGDLEPAKIEQSIAQSLDELQVSSVETMFLHVPDRKTPIQDTANTMNEAFLQGKFKKLGLSNYAPAEVQEYLDICEREGCVKPRVYEGHYNPIVRGGEKELFPLLRRNNISFFAYSPAAAGLLSGHADTSRRWKADNTIGNIYSSHYGSLNIPGAIDTVRSSAEKYGITGHAAAIRWTAFHGVLDGEYGDALIFGVSKLEQLHKTLDALEEGPLPAELADAISAVYATLGDTAPPFHM
ncbi:aflatoxin B1 aldehyde reductase member 3 [Penicillium chermesinum]|uniref:Aflatoxin B1 aldehyde reductase member 3 n=1 Tax=Penicillium chermesinum TaxID=63820 RepID=A0A9W9PJN2_9EURO|nr:aflatoxin B1 aldehyde reductase member 3 [Penicillium chermesinum]KAJ5247337.1 aflatoxin B1 aldehyde reductase member 3 [Penicillium chermesinum]KAJ6145580.1 aflatoxin B1 aldehyde reductase member 3 [Penicillium chermesinum]